MKFYKSKTVKKVHWADYNPYSEGTICHKVYNFIHKLKLQLLR